MEQRSLAAFYDLQVSPVSFDFPDFLVLAELARRRQGCEALHVVVVPGPKDGFRDDDAAYDTDNKWWRLQNIIVPSCWLSPQPVRLSLCRTRAEAAAIEAALDGPVFPEGYTTAEPRADFMLSGIVTSAVRGEAIPQLRAGNQAVRYMRRWLDSHAGERRAVTITLRESAHEPSRNSNLDAWSTFARRLDPERYCALVVRDTETAFDSVPAALEGLLLCPPAPINLDLRIALYELSWLNLMVPNGPGVVAWLDNEVRLVMFKMLNADADNTSAVYIASQGIKPGGQAPFATRFQRMVWEPDDLEVIEREFAAMATLLDAAPAGAKPPDPAKAEDPLDVAARLHLTGRLEEATAIYHDIVQKDPRNAGAWHLLGVIASQAGRPEVAERTILRAIALDPDRASYYVSLGGILRGLDRTEDATNCYLKAVKLDPNDAGAHGDLAEMLLARGDAGKATAAMAKAIRLRPDSVTLHERAARLFEEVGRPDDALRLYRHAVELRDQLRRRNQEATRHMPEIPRIAPIGG